MHALAIHGGAYRDASAVCGGDRRPYEASLAHALDCGFEILHGGGSSLDAVTTAVRILENDPLFNAGRGSALARDGSLELDAAIMDGRDERAGAVAAVKHVKNPVDLARRVMEKSSHVLLVGAGAEEFALEEQVELVPNSYFRTNHMVLELERVQARSPVPIPFSHGTVGAVALDADGNLAAATSTGGLTNKRPGRVGDSPIVGAGTYAKNGVCAVSSTGHGECFLRAVAAYRIAAMIEYGSMSLETAAQRLTQELVPKLGGSGGVIGIDATGSIAMAFNTSVMFRAARHSSGRRTIEIAR